MRGTDAEVARDEHQDLVLQEGSGRHDRLVGDDGGALGLGTSVSAARVMTPPLREQARDRRTIKGELASGGDATDVEPRRPPGPPHELRAVDTRVVVGEERIVGLAELTTGRGDDGGAAGLIQARVAIHGDPSAAGDKRREGRERDWAHGLDHEGVVASLFDDPHVSRGMTALGLTDGTRLR